MEEWQIRCIISNLDKLIKTTDCDVILLAHLLASNVFSTSDKQKIGAEKEAYGKAAKLYDILQTRINGFSSLARGLKYNNQSGALEILKSSFLQQDVRTVLSTNYTFHNWRNVLANIPDSLLQRTVRLYEDEYVSTFLFLENQTEFAIETIPNHPSYYVPRSISNRLILDQKIFKEDCPDVFVFKDIERHKLTQLVMPMGTESSSTQIDELTSKFIHLNDEADFLFMCQIRNDKPLHLVKHEDESIILEESDGKSKILRNFLKENRKKDGCFLSEDEFIHNIESDDQTVSKSCCICDSPGTGKTWLLASLARKMKTKYSDRVVVFQKLSEIVFSTDDPFDYLVSKICPNLLIRAIIKAAVNDEYINMEVFLDAMDEVDFEKVEAAKRFINSLKTSSENIRLFVTSRPHMRHELESTLGAVAYDIRPFDNQNQLDFLEQYWRTSISYVVDMSRLRNFAAACQAKVQVSLSSREKDIMGIPLQCYMLAEVYMEKAARYSKCAKATLNKFMESPVSLFEMYQRFITLKLRIVKTKTTTEEMKRAKRFHIWKALHIFSPKLNDLYRQVVLQDEQFTSSEYLSSGILEGVVCGDNPLQISFVHQTFAEYLVAEYISSTVTEMQNSDENSCKLRSCLMEFVANEVFQFFTDYYNSYDTELKYSQIFEGSWPSPSFYIKRLRSTLIQFFLNEHLRNAFSSDCVKITGSNCWLEVLRPNQLFEILLNCAVLGWLYLIKLFTRQLKLTKKTSEIFFRYRSAFLRHHVNPSSDDYFPLAFTERPVLLFYIAAKHSSVSILKQCVQLYEECFDYNFIDAIKNIPVWLKTPYHEALEQGDYSMVEYFTQFKLPFGNRWLLHQCIYDSCDEAECRIHTKIQIFNLLLNDNQHLVWDPKHADVHGPLIKSLLLTPRIHLKIIKYLLSKIQENMQTRPSPVLVELDFETIKNASGYMNKKELHELCRIFIEDLHITRTAKTTQQLTDTLNCMLERGHDVELETLQLILLQFNSAEISNLSSTLLYHCTLYHSTETFEMLFKQGVNISATDEQGFSIIHNAAKLGKKNIFKYLLRKGISVNQQTVSGMTPLMVSAEHSLSMLLFVLKHGANVDLKDQDGETFLHKFAQNLLRHSVSINLEDCHELEKFLFNQPKAMEIIKSISWKQMWNKLKDPSNYLLWWNLRHFCKKSTLLLLYEKLELDFSSCEVGYDGNNVLLEAIKYRKSLEIIKWLFECGASINITNKNRQNALHLAARAKHWQVIEYILNKSSLSPNDKDRAGNTPLHMVISNTAYGDSNTWEIPKLLLEHGSDPFSLGADNETFGRKAAWYTSEACFRLLISHVQQYTDGLARLNIKNKEGETLFHVRVKRDRGFLDNFTLNLIKHNSTVDVNLADNCGNTIFLLFAKFGNWDLVKNLAETKACITSKNNEGYNVLHFAAKNGSLEMVKYFHLRGLSLDDTTVNGDTPLLLAYSNLPVIEHLYAEGYNICAVNKNGETILHKAAESALEDALVDLVLFLKNCNVTLLFVQVDFIFRRSAIHQLLYRGKCLPGYLVNWIVNLPGYDISAEDIKGNTLFQKSFEIFNCLESCAIDAIYNTYRASVDPELLRCALLKALAASVDRDRANLDAVKYLLKKGASPNLRDLNHPMPIDKVIENLSYCNPFTGTIKRFRIYSNNENRNEYQLFQLSSILKEFLTYMLGDRDILCATDANENTFLHAIALFSHPDDFQVIVEEICAHGFTDIFSMKNNLDESPVQIAVKNNRLTEETRRLLLQNGVSTFSE